jgi:hypothetical protein
MLDCSCIYVMLMAMGNMHAVALGKMGGLKGGPARAASLSPERRSQISRKAAAARWKLVRERKVSNWSEILDRVADDRLYRQSLARQLAGRSSIDPGDLEHALFNLTLEPHERLARCLAR